MSGRHVPQQARPPHSNTTCTRATHRVEVQYGGKERHGKLMEALCELGAEGGVCRGVGHARQDALLQIRLQHPSNSFQTLYLGM